MVKMCYFMTCALPLVFGTVGYIKDMQATMPNAKGRAQVRNVHILTMCFSEVGFWNFIVIF